MQGVTYKPKNSSLGWLSQAVSGLLLIALLGLHLVANHFVVSGGLQTYQDVVNYLSHPLILVLELLLVCVVASHALLGVRAIIMDLGLSQRSERALNGILIGIGVVIFLYCVVLSLTLIR
jgi:succinate dehydrogenase hydrophobic anchor subunit